MRNTSIKNDAMALEAIQKLIDQGYSPQSVRLFMKELLVKELNRHNFTQDKNHLQNKDDIISEEYFKFIQNEFILFVGPIGQVVIKEEIEKMGYDQKFFPKNKVPELLINITSDFECNPRKKTIY